MVKGVTRTIILLAALAVGCSGGEGPAPDAAPDAAVAVDAAPDAELLDCGACGPLVPCANPACSHCACEP